MRALTAAGINSPAAIAVGVAVTMVFGLFALTSLPIQLFPDIDRPQIGIETDWRSETPREVESQLVQPEEEVLQGIPGLQEMDGYAESGQRLHQSDLRARHRHEVDADRRHRPAQPSAAAAAGCAKAVRAAREHARIRTRRFSSSSCRSCPATRATSTATNASCATWSCRGSRRSRASAAPTSPISAPAKNCRSSSIRCARRSWASSCPKSPT